MAAHKKTNKKNTMFLPQVTKQAQLVYREAPTDCDYSAICERHSYRIKYLLTPTAEVDYLLVIAKSEILCHTFSQISKLSFTIFY